MDAPDPPPADRIRVRSIVPSTEASYETRVDMLVMPGTPYKITGTQSFEALPPRLSCTSTYAVEGERTIAT